MCGMCQSLNPKHKTNTNTKTNDPNSKTTYVWEWKGGNKWYEYSEDISKQIHDAYHNGIATIALPLSHASYVIDLTKMAQINNESNKTRRIRCVK